MCVCVCVCVGGGYVVERVLVSRLNMVPNTHRNYKAY